MDRVMRLSSQKAVVIFSKSSCCMCHNVKTLFCDLDGNPVVYELNEEASGREMEQAIVKLLGRKPLVPAVFIEGSLLAAPIRSCPFTSVVAWFLSSVMQELYGSDTM